MSDEQPAGLGDRLASLLDVGRAELGQAVLLGALVEVLEHRMPGMRAEYVSALGRVRADLEELAPAWDGGATARLIGLTLPHLEPRRRSGGRERRAPVR